MVNECIILHALRAVDCLYFPHNCLSRPMATRCTCETVWPAIRYMPLSVRSGRIKDC